jgi:flagellar hook-associated protein 1 FlgK
MITPGFFGLYNAHRGLTAAQNALSTINHNISNANTPGYSRQRVDLMAYNAYAFPNNSQLNAGQIGQGPILQQVTRLRDQFLDAQFRLSNGALGQNEVMRDTLKQLEGILNEPSTSGVNDALQSFFNAAQALSVNPQNAAVRATFVQQALDLVDVFQQQALQLSDLRQNLVGSPLSPNSFTTSQLSLTVSEINQKLTSIAALNQNIVSIKATGAAPNDLLDQRDKLLDELSKLVDTNVTYYDNGQIDLSIAGQTMIKGVDLLDSLQALENTGVAPTPDDVPALVSTVNGAVVLNDGTGDEITSGKIKGILDMGGNDPNLSSVRNLMGKLDNLLGTIVGQLNILQVGQVAPPLPAGRDQNGNLATDALFLNDAALNPGQTLDIFHWKVNPAILADPKLVAAAIDDSTVAGGFAGVGDGRNALAMAQLKNQTFASLGTGLVDYFNSTTAKLGIDTQSYTNGSQNQKNLNLSVEQQRQSISGVNIDEETIDLLRYQRMLEATSKTISILDQVTQSIIALVN